jgi:alanyl-tRNA synthetase
MGFPWELTEEILHEQGLELDKDGFDTAMEAQRSRARAARAANIRVQVPDLSGIDVSKLKVDPEAKEGKVVAIWKDGKLVEEIHDGEEAGIILDKTPFYAEGGGQVGDEGRWFRNSDISMFRMQRSFLTARSIIFPMWQKDSSRSAIR